jgi:putative FmdB family regulatory protein
MPIYDYRCDHCGHAFSAVQSYKDEPLAKCPNCGKKPRRLITSAAIVFKGSGWYKTDSRPAPKAENEAKTETKAETKADTKSGTKPAAHKEKGGKTAEKSAPKGEAAS